ncbi:MAG: hypothetical protein ACE5NC_10465 [Anaerolineae bacterium]
MQAHAHDLREEVDDEELVHHISHDYREAELDEATRALLDYSVKLTLVPWRMQEEDIWNLRAHGFSDRAIHDAVQIASYFNYITRIADGLGVEPESFMEPWDWADREMPRLAALKR